MIKGHLDVIAFSGGIGEKSPIKRAATISLLKESLGCVLDPKLNKENGGASGIISKKESRPIIMVVPTNEELMIAKETLDLCLDQS